MLWLAFCKERLTRATCIRPQHLPTPDPSSFKVTNRFCPSTSSGSPIESQETLSVRCSSGYLTLLLCETLRLSTGLPEAKPILPRLRSRTREKGLQYRRRRHKSPKPRARRAKASFFDTTLPHPRHRRGASEEASRSRTSPRLYVGRRCSTGADVVATCERWVKWSRA